MIPSVKSFLIVVAMLATGAAIAFALKTWPVLFVIIPVGILWLLVYLNITCDSKRRYY